MSIAAQLRELEEYAAKEQLQIVTETAAAFRRRGGCGGCEAKSAAAPMFAEIGYNFVAQTPPFSIEGLIYFVTRSYISFLCPIATISMEALSRTA